MSSGSATATMAATPPTSDPAAHAFDSSMPLHGVVLCCTSIAPDLRAMIDRSTKEMGGIHKYDLTPEATHLIVGEYETPKYRHVARDRPDIVPMAAGWIDAMRALWIADQEIDFLALQDEWRLKTFEASGGNPSSTVPEERQRQRLLCCLTGFEDHQVRTMIEDKVRSNGGDYTGDLSKSVTHLITYLPEGKKYRAAKNWGIHTVSVEWLHDSVERGMILMEQCYDPLMPPEERGRGAWTRKEVQPALLGKRTRENGAAGPGEGRRKLRKSASMKLSSQRDNLWGDILTNRSAAEVPSQPAAPERTASLPVGDSVASEAHQPTIADAHISPEVAGPIFGACRFFVHGFANKRLDIVKEHLLKNGAEIASCIADLVSSQHPEPADQRFLLVPQSSQPENHPKYPEGVWIVTEFYIERCIQGRELVHPSDLTLGRPFPHFPIDRFSQLVICTSGFQDLQLNQVQKTIVQLGAEYSEKLNARATLLVCCSMKTARKEKLDHAVSLNKPVVDAEWLWQCIESGFLAPWEPYMYSELNQKAPSAPQTGQTERAKLARSRSEPAPKQKPIRVGIDTTGFDADSSNSSVPPTKSLRRQATTESHYQTALAFQDEERGAGFDSAPLTEVHGNALNGSSQRAAPEISPRKFKRFPTGGEIGDSEESEPPTQATASAQTETEADTAQAEQEDKESRDKVAKQEMSKRFNSLLSRDTELSEGDGSIQAPKPARRKREILGRAQSNVSAASSASGGDSSAQAGATASKIRKLKAAKAANASMDGILSAFGAARAAAVSEQDADDSIIPAQPATQLEYVDSAAKMHRAVIESKLNGDKNAPAPRDSQEDRVTMADFAGYGRQDGVADSGDAANPGTTRRAMRRR
ncbi:DNA replication regulator DPB11 [Microdochium nivale]|nr:DNA replication regulator DPB11 [Microdochium nivale]